MTYFQIYNEFIKDLLIANNFQEMAVCEHPDRGTVINGLAQVAITSKEEIMELLALGASNRVIGSTEQNSTSSRSHAVMQLFLTKDVNSFEQKVSKLTMIDLAGSERIYPHRDALKESRQKEGAAINKSLLSLGNCISGLVRLQHIQRA